MNDGICDYDVCCDGSDEYAGVGGVKCPSTCKEIGAAARKLAEKRGKVRTEGGRARAELVRKAGVLKKEVEDNVRTTEANLKGAEEQVKQLAQKLKEVELAEKSKIVNNPKPGSKVSVAVQVAREKVEEYKKAVKKLKEERDEAERKLDIAAAILTTFKGEYNPNFNDEGVKRAVRAWEEYLAADTPREKNEAEERDLNELAENDGVDWDELAGDLEGTDDVSACKCPALFDSPRLY